MLVVLDSDNGQVDSHQEVGNRQVADHHADGAVLVALRKASPQDQTVADARYGRHRPRRVPQSRLGQQIVGSRNA